MQMYEWVCVNQINKIVSESFNLKCYEREMLTNLNNEL